MTLSSGKRFTIGMACAAALLAPHAPALAQQHADEPQISPLLFGETEKERRDKISKEQEELEKAREISIEQSRDGQRADEPSLSPLLFGRGVDEREDGDITGTRIQLADDAERRGFFGALSILVPEETNLSLGVGPIYRPDYYGSNDYQIYADPQVYIRVKNFVFLDDDGADLALFGFSRFRLGPSIKIRGRRDQDDNPDLHGLGDVGTTFELGGFVSTTFLNRFSAKVRARQGVKTGHHGTVVDGALTALLVRTNPFSLATTGQVTWVDDRFADAYFSVTPEQSQRSGGRLPVYDAHAGLRSFGGGVTAYINIRDRWSLNPYATYEYVLGDFARSPIIEDFGDRHQLKVGFHLMREFSFNFK